MVRRKIPASSGPKIFGALQLLGESFVARHSGDRKRIDVHTFESLSDNLTIVRPAPRFGDFRFEFFGATMVEIAPLGELTHVSFHDILHEPFYRSCLSGYRHVVRTGLPHVTRDHQMPDEAATPYFTRLVIPIFSGNRLDLLLGATFPHEEPLAALPIEP